MKVALGGRLMPSRLIEQFCEHAKQYGAATLVGDDQRTNTLYEEIRNCLKLINEAGLIAELYPCLTAADDYIVLWAAFQLLATDREAAVYALEGLAKKPSPAGFDAKMTLKEFLAGRLRI
ncbi:MAG: hypothetical protein HC888_14300 [Candidatus Competibacteraceae bacterium]|nr:hypothetical protein [Candidatus Competibacteraceae bacterium]